MLQRLRAADIPRVRKHEAAGFVQLAECSALFCCCRHDTSLSSLADADYAGNTQPIVLEDLRPALGLVFAMQRHIAPCGESILIAEKRQRQDLALLGQALEAFDRNKAVDGFQNGPQLRREVEIFLLVVRLRPDFEDYSYHLHLPSRV